MQPIFNSDDDTEIISDNEILQPILTGPEINSQDFEFLESSQPFDEVNKTTQQPLPNNLKPQNQQPLEEQEQSSIQASIETPPSHRRRLIQTQEDDQTTEVEGSSNTVRLGRLELDNRYINMLRDENRTESERITAFVHTDQSLSPSQIQQQQKELQDFDLQRTLLMKKAIEEETSKKKIYERAAEKNMEASTAILQAVPEVREMARQKLLIMRMILCKTCGISFEEADMILQPSTKQTIPVQTTN